MLDFFESDLGVGDVVGLAVVVQIRGLPGQTGLDFVDVQESLSTDLTSVRAQQDVLAGFLLHLISKSDCLIEIKVFEKSLSELSEAIRVVFLLSKDQRQGQCLQSISLELGKLNATLASLRSGLVVRATEQESSHHRAHQVLGAQLNHVQVGVTEVLSVGQKGSEHAIRVLGGE